MKFTLSWLRDHLDTTATAAEVVEAMTMAGLEVGAVEVEQGEMAAADLGRARIYLARGGPGGGRLVGGHQDSPLAELGAAKAEKP